MDCTYLLRAGWLPLGALIVGAGMTQAQGSFQCANGTLKNAFITDCDGKPVGGTNYLVEIHAQNPRTGKLDPGLMRYDGDGTRPLGNVKLLSERNPGRFSAGTVLVPFVPPGEEVTLEVRAWDVRSGATYEAATRRGASTFKMLLGGVGNPPTMPNPMTRFTGVRICDRDSVGK